MIVTYGLPTRWTSVSTQMRLSSGFSGSSHTCLHAHTGTLNSDKLLAVRGNGTSVDASAFSCLRTKTTHSFYKTSSLTKVSVGSNKYEYKQKHLQAYKIFVYLLVSKVLKYK